MARRKPRRTYMPGIVGGQIMMPADLERLHKYMLDIEHIDQISDQMRAVVAPRKRPPLTMPNLSQGRAPQTAVMLEPKNPEPGSASEKGESYGPVRRGRQK